MTTLATPARKTAAIFLLMTMTVLGVFPLDVILPSFPSMATHFGTSVADIALSVSLFSIGLSLSLLLVGPLSDNLGRKRLLMIGMTVAVIGSAGCAMADDFTTFLVFRVVQAVGCGSFVLSQALVQDLFVGKEQERLRIAIVTAGGICISVSPLFGSWLQTWLDWRGSFQVFGVIGLVLVFKAWLLLESPSTAPSVRIPILKAYRQVLSDRRFVGYWLISALAFTCHFAFIVVSPIILMEQLALTPYQFSLALLLYGAAYVLGGMGAGWMNRRMEGHTQIVTGLRLIALAGVLMLVLHNVWGLSVITVMLPMILCTAGTTITRPIATSRAMGLFPHSAGTSASAGNVIIFVSGGLISGLVSQAGTQVMTVLPMTFLILSAIGMGLNALVQRPAHVS
ncbi:Bcr/CflA family efflux MFS transporter [Pseudomonas sp. BIGb0164]|uniref:Bcr/CflA family efflux MFS transporter n=1 Tax=Pseudomonas sp. BIGb0164 TaxID=2940605 RepID=UPI00216A61D1|nr:Bcr/CflA family efflux MFS transporter [Pseudomonas sp. BIGb0164]MCS4247514.1 DHA1 family bicyclomycin/chloramphenicol resistance-like MFS transporter [Pseudomonas sp. BIGb0164]